MTQRLYYTNAYLTRFDATVTQVRSADGRTLVALDRSAFYPTSGGQPHDLGTLAGTPIVDVNADDGIVWHTLAGAPALAMGQTVAGEIEWPRRHDLMQQHSAQHLLSQVLIRLYAAETVSVHFGEAESTLDLDTPSLDWEQIAAAERTVQAIIEEARPIRAYFVDEAQIVALNLRRPPKVAGTIRIVEIEQYDYSACGGTHVRDTAQIGPVKVIRSERRRGITRLTFLAGSRAINDYARKHALLQELAALFSSDVAQTPALAARAVAQAKDAQRRAEELTARLMALEAQALLADTPPVNGLRIVTALRDDLDAAALRTLATTLAQAPDVVALVGSAFEGKLLLAFARSSAGGAGLAALHMGNLLRATLQQAGGSGGGRPDFAQGGGVDAGEGERLLAYARGQIGDRMRE